MPNTKSSHSKWPKFFNVAPEWQNFAKSGHTGTISETCLEIWEKIPACSLPHLQLAQEPKKSPRRYSLFTIVLPLPPCPSLSLSLSLSLPSSHIPKYTQSGFNAVQIVSCQFGRRVAAQCKYFRLCVMTVASLHRG